MENKIIDDLYQTHRGAISISNFNESYICKFKVENYKYCYWFDIKTKNKFGIIQPNTYLKCQLAINCEDNKTKYKISLDDKHIYEIYLNYQNFDSKFIKKLVPIVFYTEIVYRLNFNDYQETYVGYILDKYPKYKDDVYSREINDIINTSKMLFKNDITAICTTAIINNIDCARLHLSDESYIARDYFEIIFDRVTNNIVEDGDYRDITLDFNKLYLELCKNGYVVPSKEYLRYEIIMYLISKYDKLDYYKPYFIYEPYKSKPVDIKSIIGKYFDADVLVSPNSGEIIKDCRINMINHGINRDKYYLYTIKDSNLLNTVN